jgi:UPF0755 protein
MKKLLKRMLIGLLALALFSGVAAWWLMHEYRSPGPLIEQKTVLFKRGSGFEQIADTLEAEGAIRHAWHFKLAGVLTGTASRLKAGEYAFPAGINEQGILAMMSEGRVVVHKITVPEGLTSREVLAILAHEPTLEGEVDPVTVPEGALLPETYHFVYGDLRQDLVDRMQQGMRDTLAGLWEKRKPGLPFTNPREALILASIVERETGLASERGRVAAVYINRLKRGMKLQADPTVAYGVGLGKGPAKSALTLNDLRAPTPYNTYVNQGLPPTPIANPGRASLEAVLNPPDTEELFFVATGTGGHRFATTDKEHEKNVQAYRAALHKAQEDKGQEQEKTQEEKAQ